MNLASLAATSFGLITIELALGHLGAVAVDEAELSDPLPPEVEVEEDAVDDEDALLASAGGWKIGAVFVRGPTRGLVSERP